jgi:hypothetical protein
MSFYNVTNPSNYNTVSDARLMLTRPAKIVRTSSAQQLTAATSLTAQQLVAGVIFVGGTTYTVTLPSATDLITLFLGPSGFDVSNNDIFTLRVKSTASGAVSIATGTGGSGGPISVSAGAEKFINIKLSITVSGGSPVYAYSLF